MGHNLYLPEEDVVRLLDAARGGSYADYALLATVYVLALRSGEAGTMRRDEVNYGQHHAVVYVLKRSKTKRKDGVVIKERKPAPAVPVPVDQDLLDIWAEYVRQSPASPWLFPHPSDPTRGITRGLVKYAYHKAAEKIGLGDGYVWHVHLLRASRATHKARALNLLKTPPLEAVASIQETLRHTTPTMAFEYVKTTSETTEQARKADAALTSRILGGGKK